MSENVQQRERIAKNLTNRGIEVTDEIIDQIIANGGTTAAVNEFVKSKQPQKPSQSNQSLNAEAGGQMIQEMVEEITEANSNQLADAIQALTLVKAMNKVQTGYTGDFTKSAIDSLKKGLSDVYSQVSTSVKVQCVEGNKVPSLLQIESPKLLSSDPD